MALAYNGSMPFHRAQKSLDFQPPPTCHAMLTSNIK
jgi:hypothetical protein